MINDAPQLIVPHPRMHERRFVIEPLIELMGNQALLTVSNHIINDNNEMIERSMASTTKTLSDCFSDVMHQACVKITTPII
jgi:7,8-dihydro-6-hydroxymethylpterin-pyrophosphokinase